MKKLAFLLFFTFTILILFACGTEKDSEESINSSTQSEEVLNELHKKQFNKAVTLIENHFGSLLEFHEYGMVCVDDEIGKLVIGFKDENGEKEKKFKEVIKKEFDKEYIKFTKLKHTTAELDEMMNEIMVDFHNYEMGDREFGINSKEETLYLKTNGLTESEKSELLEKYGYILTSIEPLEESYGNE